MHSIIKKIRKNKHINKIAAILIFALLAMAIPGKNDSYARNRTVKLMGNGHQCSGEQVRAPSGIDYILSAGHCTPLIVDGRVTVILENEKTIERRVIAEDMSSDLLLIEGIPNMRGLDIGRNNQRFQKVMTFTHGAGLDTYKTEGVVIQKQVISVLVKIMEPEELGCEGAKYKIIEFSNMFGMPMRACILHLEEIVMTAFVVPGSSGGMVLDSNYNLIGVVSATNGSFSFMVGVDQIQRFLSAY